MRRFLALGGLVILAACAPRVPESGFYGATLDERAARDSALEGTASTVPPAGTETVDGGAPEIDVNNPGISDTQDFEAVSARQTIESDAERLQAMRQQYEFVEPQPLPERRNRVNIAQFALSTTHSVGDEVYRRGPFAGVTGGRRCGRFKTANDAQMAFLESGGPERDRLGLDPDGDGFACDWSPEIFRRMAD